MKAVGVLMALAGWLLPVLTLVVTQSTVARLILCLLGIGTTLVGVLVVLNKAHLKQAIWKA